MARHVRNHSDVGLSVPISGPSKRDTSADSLRVPMDRERMRGRVSRSSGNAILGKTSSEDVLVLMGLAVSDRLTPDIAMAGLKVTSIAIGGSHTLFLTQEGHVYARGGNDYGQLGVGDLNSRSVPQIVTSKHFIGGRVVHVAAGRHSSAAIVEYVHPHSSTSEAKKSRTVYIWGTLDPLVPGRKPRFTNVPVPVHTEEDMGERFHPTKVCLGTSLGAILEGGVGICWMVGPFISEDGSDGTDLVEDGEHSVATSFIPDEFVGFRIKDIAAGCSHLILNTTSNVMLSTGSNSHGQLGNGRSGYGDKFVMARGAITIESVILPNGFDNRNILDMACGSRHSVVVMDTGEVIVWGDNTHGQLGIKNPNGTTMFVSQPVIVAGLRPRCIFSVNCGYDFTVFHGVVLADSVVKKSNGSRRTQYSYDSVSSEDNRVQSCPFLTYGAGTPVPDTDDNGGTNSSGVTSPQLSTSGVEGWRRSLDSSTKGTRSVDDGSKWEVGEILPMMEAFEWGAGTRTVFAGSHNIALVQDSEHRLDLVYDRIRLDAEIVTLRIYGQFVRYVLRPIISSEIAYKLCEQGSCQALLVRMSNALQKVMAAAWVFLEKMRIGSNAETFGSKPQFLRYMGNTMIQRALNEYAQVIADCIAVNFFERCKLSSPFKRILSEHIKVFQGATYDIIDRGASEESFGLNQFAFDDFVLRYLDRTHRYVTFCKLLESFASKAPFQLPYKVDEILKVHHQWEELISNMNGHIINAEHTRDFCIDHNLHAIRVPVQAGTTNRDAFKVTLCAMPPDRRLLLSSKHRPLVPVERPSAFAQTPAFHLFNDVLHSPKVWGNPAWSCDLRFLWINHEPVSSSRTDDALKPKRVFDLVMPTRKVSVHCDSTEDLVQWIKILYNAIHKRLIEYGGVEEQNDGNGRLSPGFLVNETQSKQSPRRVNDTSSKLLHKITYGLARRKLSLTYLDSADVSSNGAVSVAGLTVPVAGGGPLPHDLIGKCYSGEWYMGHPHGKGETVDREGTVFEGSFIQGVRHGQGRLTSLDGRVLTGNWREGVIDGHGTIVDGNGDYFDGHFKDDKEHGLGYAVTRGGECHFFGEYLAGRRKGFGILVDRIDGICKMGHFDGDKLSGYGFSFQRSRDTPPSPVRATDNARRGSEMQGQAWHCHVGHFIQGKSVGRGRLILSSGYQVEGSFSSTNQSILDGGKITGENGQIVNATNIVIDAEKWNLQLKDATAYLLPISDISTDFLHAWPISVQPTVLMDHLADPQADAWRDSIVQFWRLRREDTSHGYKEELEEETSAVEAASSIIVMAYGSQSPINPAMAYKFAVTDACSLAKALQDDYALSPRLKELMALFFQRITASMVRIYEDLYGDFLNKMKSAIHRLHTLPMRDLKERVGIPVDPVESAEEKRRAILDYAADLTADMPETDRAAMYQHLFVTNAESRPSAGPEGIVDVEAIVKQLRDVVSASHPLVKAEHVLKAFQLLTSSTQNRAGALDDILPWIIYYIVRLNEPSWPLHLLLMSDFLPVLNASSGEISYALITLMGALRHLVDHEYV
eukprot:Clim_evm23s225 gene=Clim_evmTU23s225